MKWYSHRHFVGLRRFRKRIAKVHEYVGMKSPGKKCFFLLLLLSVFQPGSGWPQSVAPEKPLTLLDAVESTLRTHPLIRSQQAQVQISRGLREQASGAFNSFTTGSFVGSHTEVPLTTAQQQQNAVFGIGTTAQITRAIDSNVEVQRLFRNGTTITQQFLLGRASDNISSVSGISSSALDLLISVPMLRGRGRQATAAQEEAAKIEVNAALLDLNQLISQLMSNTASSYWNLVAARKLLTIASDAEDRGSLYLHDVQALVDADHVPRNDLHTVIANLASRTSARLAAEQQMFAAQEQLALDMGISAERLFRDLPKPANDFPDGDEQLLPSDTVASMQFYLDQSLQRRADYLASQQRTAETRTLLAAAHNKTLPQVNLNFGTGYSGLQPGGDASNFFASTVNGIQGPNARVGITYNFFGSNQSARGELMRAMGATTQAEMQNREVARTISSQVAVAVEAVRSALFRVKKARQSVNSFQSALAGERDKYAGGIGSVVDTLAVEDKLTAALQDEVQAELSYALALTQFRFATGTLLEPNQSLQDIQADIFVTVPFAGAPQRP
jgi:outer membrane protein